MVGGPEAEDSVDANGAARVRPPLMLPPRISSRAVSRSTSAAALTQPSGSSAGIGSGEFGDAMSDTDDTCSECPSTTMSVSSPLCSGRTAASEADRGTQECVVCLDRQRDCLLMPCRHLVVCQTCGDKLGDCPVCRTAVALKIRVFTS
eukprot:TRINITY_DN5509_c0_g1_i1.p2 TRINITY_DN5509_c0_g1~~TRINITY_DN5509_c0_g1_i1.p2  ORF type:complete len:148 (+),score=24.54 TRINITY_DN5509_c0_g1_i1:658-1101(+)